MNQAGLFQASGSAFFGFIRKALKFFENERGEVGDGTDLNAGDGTLPPDGGTPPDSAAGTGDQSLPDGTDTGQPPGDGTPPTDDLNVPWRDDRQYKQFLTERQKIAEERAQRAAEIEQVRAEADQHRKIAEFYQQQMNEAARLPRTQAPRQPAVQPGMQQPGIDPATQLPPGIKPPEQWESRDDEAKWVNHTAMTHARTVATQMLQQAQSAIAPIFENIGRIVTGLQENVAKSTIGAEKWDKAIEAASQDIFNVGPDGKVYGVKNPALLAYIKAQPNSYLALAQHGLTKLAPNAIKTGIQQNTAAALKALGTKPKGPTQPTGTQAPGEPVELDWDTPASQRDAVLKKRGIIG